MRPTGPRLVEEVLSLYRDAGSSRYDEAVTQAEHGAQAAHLAREEGADDALVAAALLHDIGHLLLSAHDDRGEPVTDLHHEQAGAQYLARRFPASVSGPTALHVAAKRYLCAVDPAYHDGLSPGSVHSLDLQGGPMTSKEVAAFERHDRWEDAVRLRRWDDAAKVPGRSVPPVDSYRDLLVGLLEHA